MDKETRISREKKTEKETDRDTCAMDIHACHDYQRILLSGACICWLMSVCCAGPLRCARIHPYAGVHVCTYIIYRSMYTHTQVHMDMCGHSHGYPQDVYTCTGLTPRRWYLGASHLFDLALLVSLARGVLWHSSTFHGSKLHIYIYVYTL